MANKKAKQEQKKRLEHLALVLGAFFYLYLLSRDTYLLGWLARRHFCWLWAVSAAAYLLKKEKFARWFSCGALIGIPLGQFAENLKPWFFPELSPDQLGTIYLGVAVYFAIVAFFSVVGFLIQIHKKRHRRTNARHTESN